MVNSFDIQPEVGALPIRFGMLRDDVHLALGAPEVSHPQFDGGGRYDFALVDYWQGSHLNVGYNKRGMVIRVSFVPGGLTVTLNGEPLWSPETQPDPNWALLRLDPSPMDFVGSLVFLALGVSTGGYHDEDPGNLSLCASPKGAWDELTAISKPADIGRYHR